MDRCYLKLTYFFVFIGMITTLPLRADGSCPFPELTPKLLSPHRLTRTEFEQGLQAEWERFFREKGKGLTDRSVPNLFKIAPQFIEHDRKSRTGENRYSNQRAFQYGNHGAEQDMDHAQVGGKFVQIHVKNFKGYSDQDIRDFGARANTQTAWKRAIEVQIDISSTNSEAFDEAFRIAGLLGNVKTIRTYIREPGTVKEMMDVAVKDLKKAADRAAKLNIGIVLEQHEVLIASEIKEILRRVDRPNLKVLFDFANPITAGAHPELEIEILDGDIVIAHVKDAIRAPTLDGGEHQIGVKLGEGDLNVRRMIYELIMREVDLSNQSVIGYTASAADRSKSFRKRPPSRTYVSPDILRDPEKLKALLILESRDSYEQVGHLIWIRAKLREFAKRALREDWQNDRGSELPDFEWRISREAGLASQIESIGQELFPKNPKMIWAVSPEISEAQWKKISRQGGNTKSLPKAKAAIRRAQRLKEELSPPLYSPSSPSSD